MAIHIGQIEKRKVGCVRSFFILFSEVVWERDLESSGTKFEPKDNGVVIGCSGRLEIEAGGPAVFVDHK